MKKIVKCGNVYIGGKHPISIQSMTNVNPHDFESLLSQIRLLKDSGCEIVRLAIPDMKAANVLKKLKKNVDIPLVADIHFDYRLAIESIKCGADKIRINPGNIGSKDKIKEVVVCAKSNNIPIRVGVNSGSLEKHLIEKYGGVTARGLAQSAINNLNIIEGMGYDNLVVSLKSSNVRMNYEAYKIVSSETPYPLHIGVTEAGTLKSGKLKSALGLGALLLENIGNTMRVSLTADPVEEVKYGVEILKTLGLRENMLEIVSCPTCGRTKIGLETLANEVDQKLRTLEIKKPLKVAVMGCVVNGPGEAREADYGIAGGDGKAVIFKKGVNIKTVKEDLVLSELLELIKQEL